MTENASRHGPLVVHLLPYDGIGGAEVAARSLEAGEHDGVTFCRYYLTRSTEAKDERYVVHGPASSLNNPRAYFAAVKFLFRKKPNLVIVSLWRGALVLILTKLLCLRIKTVIFVHLSGDLHALDRVFNRLAMRLSDEIWTDSTVTLNKRVPKKFKYKTNVISFVLRRCSIPILKLPVPRFIFWGRLHKQKNLNCSLKIFQKIFKRYPSAEFVIIGPDGGEEKKLRDYVKKFNMENNVVFKGAMNWSQIAEEAKNKAFYLQTSEIEGMAISVVEAMQLGLVPIVTPVGEIGFYCQDGINAVFVRTDDQAISEVLKLLSDREKYRSMARSAANHWRRATLYREDVLARSCGLVQGLG